MPVRIKYVVERHGVEKMTFTTKKAADAYDKQLDIAEALLPFVAAAAPDIAEAQHEAIAFYFAEHRERAMILLRGGKVTERPEGAPTKAAVVADSALDEALQHASDGSAKSNQRRGRRQGAATELDAAPNAAEEAAAVG